MKLLDRYIVRQFSATFIMLVIGLPLLFIVVDITDNLDRYLARGIPMDRVALSYLYYLPQFIFWSMPIAALIATVFTIGNMTRHQEITAAKAGGVSFYRLMRPVVMLATILSVVAIGVGELIPVTNRLRAEALGERQVFTSSLRTNFVYQAADGRVIGSRVLDAVQGQMTNVSVERESRPGTSALLASAQRAVWADTTGWHLHDGRLRILDDAGTELTLSFESMRMVGLEETPSDLLAVPKNPEEMRFGEMERAISTLERSGGSGLELRVERSNRIALPLAILVIVLFGAPLSTSSKRGGAAFGIGISLAVTMVYLMLFKVGSAFGESGAVNPILATWFPNVLFLVAAGFLLTRVRT